METITLSIELTKEDFYQFSYFTTWKAAWNNKKRNAYYLKSIVGSIIGFILIFYFSEKNISVEFIALLSVLLLLYFFILVPNWIRHRYRKFVDRFYDSPDNSSFFQKTELTIDDKGILSKDQISTTMHLWQAFIRKAETEEYYYLYLNSQLGFIIPKRVFSSQKEKEDFDNILMTYLPLIPEFESLSHQ